MDIKSITGFAPRAFCANGRPEFGFIIRIIIYRINRIVTDDDCSAFGTCFAGIRMPPTTGHPPKIDHRAKKSLDLARSAMHSSRLGFSSAAPSFPMGFKGFGDSEAQFFRIMKCTKFTGVVIPSNKCIVMDGFLASRAAFCGSIHPYTIPRAPKIDHRAKIYSLGLIELSNASRTQQIANLRKYAKHFPRIHWKHNLNIRSGPACVIMTSLHKPSRRS